MRNNSIVVQLDVEDETRFGCRVGCINQIAECLDFLKDKRERQHSGRCWLTILQLISLTQLDKEVGWMEKNSQTK